MSEITRPVHVDGKHVASWIPEGGNPAADVWTLFDAGATGDHLGSVHRFGSTHEWTGHRTGDGRRPRVYPDRPTAMAYVVNRCQQIGALPKDGGKPETVTFRIAGHGHFTVTAAALDVSIARYLPSTKEKLRDLVSERSTLGYADVDTAIELIAMLADFDHNVDDSPLRAY